MFAKTLPHITLPYSADRHFVAIGNTTWQTKNIAAVSVAEHQIIFDIPEPVSNQKRPVPKTNWRYLVYGVPAVGLLAFGGGSIIFSLFMLAALLGLIAFIRIYGYRNSINQWSEQRASTARRSKAWEKLRNDMPNVYTLVLDTSSGKSVALTTFDLLKLQEIRAAIFCAMSADSDEKISGQLDAVDCGNEKLEDFYRKYCLNQMQ